MQKTVTIEDISYTVATISAGDAEAFQQSHETSYRFGMALVAASLVAGGDATATYESVRALPFFSTYQSLLAAAQEVNGLRKAKQGEAPAAPATTEAATGESTSSESTAS